MRTIAALIAIGITVLPVFVPARRLSGSLPALPPPTVVDWVDESVELEVDASGNVDRATLLRANSRAPSLLVPAVADWRFQPATDGQGRTASRVLAAAMFRPPRLDDWPVPREPPIEFAAPSAEVPVPLTTPRPAYPPAPVADEVVLVESHVEIDGRVTEAKCLSGSSSFCPAALTAARGWTFLPAQRDGEPVPAFVYIAFGFRRPR